MSSITTDAPRTTPTEPTDDPIALLRAADALVARALALLARRPGALEAQSGLPAEMALRLVARRTGWDAREIAAAAEALRAMPATLGALEAGDLSWSQVRAVCRATRELRAAERQAVDALVGSRVAALVRAEPERIVSEVEDLAAGLRADLGLRREERAIESSFLSLQPRIGGGGTIYGEADTERFATICDTLDARAARPASALDPDSPSRGAQYIDALVALCEADQSGDLGRGSDRARPRPRLIACVDLDAVAGEGLSPGARVLSSVIGGPQPLSTLATEVAACDAEIIPVLFRGAQPIAVGERFKAPSERTRTAVVARDRGCRFPGCDAPASWSDCHHLVPRPAGTNDPENLALLCRRCHRRVHRQRWALAVQRDGTIRFAHRGRTFDSPTRRPPPPMRE